MSATAERVRDPATAPDGALARAHLAGQSDAFGRLYERFFGRLVALCLHHVKDTATAEDLAQEALVRALEALAGFDTTCPMWPWLKRIATNLAIDHVRKHSRSHPSGLLDETLSQGDDVCDPAWGATDDFTDELAERWLVEAALRAIPPRQAAALELCYLEGWSQASAAALLETSGNAFKQLLWRARRTLADEYDHRSSAAAPHPPTTAGVMGEVSPSHAGERPPAPARPNPPDGPRYGPAWVPALG